jgi:hypothetical protein
MLPKNPMAATATPTEADVAVQQTHLVLARRLRQLNRPILGLLPFPAELRLENVPRCLGKALASLGVRVALVEPRERWRAGPTQAPLRVTAVDEAMDLLVPEWTERSNVCIVLEETLTVARDRYGCILLDLSGLDPVAAQEVAAIPDVGIVLFVARGKSSEFALVKARRRLSAKHLLGAVLMDVESSASAPVA